MRKHNYVVGYLGEGQCVYGKDGWINLFTLKQAKEGIKELTTPARKAIYKLVIVKEVL